MRARHQKKTSRRKARLRYYPAPPKSRASYFFSSFILTLAFSACLMGFVAADVNSRRVGWNQASEVFAAADSGDNFHFTVLGKDYSLLLPGASALAVRLRAAAVPLLPNPAQCAALACLHLRKPAEQLCGTAALRLLRLLRYPI